MRKLLIIFFLFIGMALKAQYPDFMPEFKVLNTAADIQLHNAVNGATVLLRGIDTINDTKGGFFQFNSVSLDAPDGLDVFAVTGVPVGRWLRVNIYPGTNGTAIDTIFSFHTDSIVVNKKLRIPLTDTTHAKKGCGNLIYDTILEHYYGDVCLNGVHDHWGCFDCTSGAGTISQITASNNYAETWTITNPTGPTTNLSLVIDTTLISTRGYVNSKTITINAGTNITISQAATQNLGTPPSWTINATVPAGYSRQIITSGTSGTVTGGNYIVTIDPAATLATYTLTMPASPSDLDIVEVDFGGTLTNGIIVTALTISANSGQTILDNTPPGNAMADNTLFYRYRTANTTWYRFKP